MSIADEIACRQRGPLACRAEREDASCVVLALAFPGQAAEEPGMGLALARVDPRAARLLALASDATGVDVARAIERGGRALHRTDVLQPALVAVSLGAAHALARHEHVDVVLGHSLGELAAACFALDLDDETSIALAADRGKRMADAAVDRPGGMFARATSVAARGVVLAAHNAPDEHVFSGDEDAIARALRADPRANRLRVAGSWHSEAMRSAVAPFRDRAGRALDGRSARCTLLSAVTAAPVGSHRVADLLADGLVSPVRWVDTLRALPALGVTTLALAPPGRVARSLARRTLGTTLKLRELAADR